MGEGGGKEEKKKLLAIKCKNFEGKWSYINVMAIKEAVPMWEGGNHNQDFYFNFYYQLL